MKKASKKVLKIGQPFTLNINIKSKHICFREIVARETLKSIERCLWAYKTSQLALNWLNLFVLKKKRKEKHSTNGRNDSTQLNISSDCKCQVTSLVPLRAYK